MVSQTQPSPRSSIRPSARSPFFGATNRGLLHHACVILLGLSVATIFCPSGAGQSQTSNTETEVWPDVDAHIQLPSNFRVLVFGGTEQAIGFPYQQWYAAGGLGYQLKSILTPHLENIDQDKEHYLVFGGGYEFLRTIQSGKTSDENRIALDGVFSFRPTGRFLVLDRNRVEFRWIDGVYSTTYRNKLLVERDFLLRRFRFSPYGSVEVFYNGAQSSWNQEWYYVGIQWPHKRIFMVDTYYQRQNCTGCTPTNWNVAGVTLNFYFRNTN